MDNLTPTTAGLEVSEAKHTPGPWVVHQIPSMPETVGHYVVTEDGLTVCHVEYQLPERVGAAVVEVKRRANARLIAAAPELLTALQNLCGEWTGGDGMSLGERIHMARAAIAKATGAAEREA